jgi:succinyl-diaminopimelate desuccinylase
VRSARPPKVRQDSASRPDGALVTNAADITSIVELLTALVRIASRGGIDACEPVLACVETWFAAHEIATRRIVGKDGEPLGLYAEVRGTAAPRSAWRPYYLLNATLDTASFGDVDAWSHAPLSAHVTDDWLYGRGAADSKAGVAIFAHLLAAFARRTDEFSGTLGALFDLDEHTGRFGGARAFFDASESFQAARPDGVFIGYPGIDRIVVGGRGFLRARLVVHGIAAHSGGSSTRGLNAAIRGGDLAVMLNELALPADENFDRPPQLTVTGIHSGDGTFTGVPDRCELTVDIRLTPGFDATFARQHVTEAIKAHDAPYPSYLNTSIEWIDGWPAYRVPNTHPMVHALHAAARDVLGDDLPRVVAGPSNIGNYLASLSVPALCGFGVRGEGIHAANERIDLATIGPAYRTYESALLTLLHR